MGSSLENGARDDDSAVLPSPSVKASRGHGRNVAVNDWGAKRNVSGGVSTLLRDTFNVPMNDEFRSDVMFLCRAHRGSGSCQ